jgi:asparagine synthetase B (glutamine-hydrolysing)
MSFPAFMGIVASEIKRTFAEREGGWRHLWKFDRPRLQLWVRELQDGRDFYSWSAEGDENAMSIFLRGRPLIATDSEFGPETKVVRIPDKDLAERIARLYQRHGTEAFALLEGSFSLVVWDGRSQTILLVVDKFGCDDIYFCKSEENLTFASDPLLVADHSPKKLNAKAAAFFLAQEGFVPAPFTLFEEAESIGRAKLLRIQPGACGSSVEPETYWRLPETAVRVSPAEAVERFHLLISEATASRCAEHNGILLSGGVDSSLLVNVIARRKCGETIALTGAVVGNGESESEMRRAGAVSSALGIPHEPVYLDPHDDNLPDEWVKCTASWSAGTRVTLPLFYRIARRMRELYGMEWAAFSGQMADTLADNNYTLSSPGYAVRRIVFSSGFFKSLPFMQAVSPGVDSQAGRFLSRVAKTAAGPRFSGMLASVLDGLGSQPRFYEGRIFGYGEMPGRSRIAFPVLTVAGFEEVADWYSDNYVEPVVERLTPESFYAGMIELSMDMCMLHLDTRLTLHAMRLCGGSMQFPFLDCRIVGLFANLPYSLRAFYRRPKYVIHAQFEKHGYIQPEITNRKAASGKSPQAAAASASSEELLLNGALGVYFRDLLRDGNPCSRAPGLCELIDEGYVDGQLRAFQAGLSGVNYKFIARMAALEQWCQMCEEASIARAAAIA